MFTRQKTLLQDRKQPNQCLQDRKQLKDSNSALKQETELQERKQHNQTGNCYKKRNSGKTQKIELQDGKKK